MLPFADMRIRLRATTMLGGVAVLTLAGWSGLAAAQEAAGVEDIVVTGSRLVRSDLSAPSPTTIIGQEQIANSGATTIESVLNEFPQLSGGNTSSVNSGGGSGVLTANLRGLGANRTLTLVNGRRFIPANGAGNVDLGTIPSALVERVEIITGGASAIYGSDAIAGAVNFILRNDIDGLETSYQYGQATAGDARSHKIDVTFGTPFAEGRGNIILHAGYMQRDGVMMEDRRFSRTPLDSATMNPTGSGNIPGGRVAVNVGQLAGQLPRGPNCTSPQNSIRFGEGAEVFQYCTPEDLYNYAKGNYLLRPYERQQFAGIARYRVIPSVEVYGELHYVNTKNQFQQASDSLNVLTPDQPYFEVANYATNPVLPAQLRQFFIDNATVFDPLGTGNARLAGGIARRFDELGLRNFAFDRTTVGVTGGLRGELDFGANQWRWDLFAQFQHSRTDEVVQGMMSSARLGLGLNTTVDGAGNVVCANPILGCVPVNPFGLNAFGPEAAAFITPHRSSTEKFARTVIGGSLAGDLFQLPAGAVAAALGFEYRKDKYDYMPGATDLAREYGSSSRGITEGGYDVAELFGELRVPILSGVSFADSLAVEGAVRYSDYSNFGGAYTWKLGVEWAPVNWMRFRAAYNRANRAPAISELYSPIVVGFAAGSDPCAAANNPTAAQKQLCVQQGVPAAAIDTFTPSALGFNQRSGGNADLQDETSKTYTAGVVVHVPWVSGLNIAVDYFKIEVDNAVATLGAADTLRVCFELLDINSAPCRAITRIQGNGEVFEVNASSSNIGSRTVEGIDLSADWSLPLPEAIAFGSNEARLALTLNANWMFKQVNQLIGANPIDCAGYFGTCTRMGAGGTPDFSANFGARYASGPVMVGTQVRYISALKPMAGVTAPLVNAGAVAYWDLNGSVDLNDHLQLFGGFNNLLDRQPRILGQAHGGDSNTDVTLYDPVGRSFFAGVRARF